MNVLISTAHPAQVHNFKHLKWELEKAGHNVFWVATIKDISDYLLKYYEIDYIRIQKPNRSFFNRINTLIVNTIKCIRVIREYNIDIIISRISPYLALAGTITNTYHLALADTESAGFYNLAFAKFIDQIWTPSSFNRKLKPNQVYFEGNIELFYLHPFRFKLMTRDAIYELLGFNSKVPYVIIRFVSWTAFHDKDLTGFSLRNKCRAVYEFSQNCRVIISSEDKLPDELMEYKYNIPFEMMHHVIAYADLVFGESATMASEAAVLGTPSIYLNDNNDLGIINEEVSAGLVFKYGSTEVDQRRAISKGSELISSNYKSNVVPRKHRIFINEKPDLTTKLFNYLTSLNDE